MHSDFKSASVSVSESVADTVSESQSACETELKFIGHIVVCLMIHTVSGYGCVYGSWVGSGPVQLFFFG